MRNDDIDSAWAQVVALAVGAFATFVILIMFIR